MTDERYYSKLPTDVTADLVFILDRESTCTTLLTPALIATGGTAIAALQMLLDWGLKQNQIKIISVLGSKQGVQHVTDEFPEVEVGCELFKAEARSISEPSTKSSRRRVTSRPGSAMR